MTTSIDVARQLVELAYQEPEPEPLTPLRVQKLVYYCQGWALALLGRPLFEDRIEAWRNGPVAVQLFQQLQSYQAPFLTPEIIGASGPLTVLEKELVTAVWKRFRDLSAPGLYRKTQAEQPWLAARDGTPAEVNGGAEITQESMTAFFTAELDKETVGGITPRQDWASYEDILQGRILTKAEVFARLRGKVCATS